MDAEQPDQTPKASKERRHGSDDRRGPTEDRRFIEHPGEEVPGQVREEDMEPHAGLRYIARLFKVLAVLLLLLMVGEIVVGLLQEGRAAVVFLVVEATRLLVFAGFLWGAGDFAQMQIESNHDLRAARILLARLLARVEDATESGRRTGGLM